MTLHWLIGFSCLWNTWQWQVHPQLWQMTSWHFEQVRRYYNLPWLLPSLHSCWQFIGASDLTLSHWACLLCRFDWGVNNVHTVCQLDVKQAEVHSLHSEWWSVRFAVGRCWMCACFGWVQVVLTRLCCCWMLIFTAVILRVDLLALHTLRWWCCPCFWLLVFDVCWQFSLHSWETLFVICMCVYPWGGFALSLPQKSLVV